MSALALRPHIVRAVFTGTPASHEVPAFVDVDIELARFGYEHITYVAGVGLIADQYDGRIRFKANDVIFTYRETTVLCPELALEDAT